MLTWDLVALRVGLLRTRARDRLAAHGAVAVAPLVERLHYKSHGVRIAAAVALGRIGDARATAALLALLADVDPLVGKAAVDALGSIRDVRAVEPLINVLDRKEDYPLKRSAIAALGNIGTPASVARLTELLDTGFRWQAISALESAGQAGVESLVAMLSHADLEVRKGAAVALGRTKGAGAVPALLAVGMHDSNMHGSVERALALLNWNATDDHEMVGVALATGKYRQAVALGRLAVPHLVGLLSTGLPIVRERAAVALGEIGDPSAVEPLIAALRDIGAQACAALARLGDRKATGSLIAALGDTDFTTREGAALALGHLGQRSAIEALIAALEDRDSRVRRAAATALSAMPDERAIDPLISMLKDEDWVREAVVTALTRAGPTAIPPLLSLAFCDGDIQGVAVGILRSLGWTPRDAQERALVAVAEGHYDAAIEEGALQLRALTAALSSSYAGTRVDVLKTLGRLADDRVVALLSEALSDTDSSVRKVAADVLAEVNDARAVEPLIRVLRDPENEVRRSAALALGALRAESAIRPLIAALSDPDGYVRAFAQGALAKVGPDAVKPLLELLSQRPLKDRDLAPQIMSVLGMTKDPRAIGPLVTRMQSDPYDTRATEALGSAGRIEALAPLLARYRTVENLVAKIAAGRAIESVMTTASEQAPDALLQDLLDSRQVLIVIGQPGRPPDEEYDKFSLEKSQQLARMELGRRARTKRSNS